MCDSNGIGLSDEDEEIFGICGGRGVVMRVGFGVLGKSCVAAGEISGEDEEECDEGVRFVDCVADGADGVGGGGGIVGGSVDEVGVFFEVIAEGIVFGFDEVRVHLRTASRRWE